MKSNTKLVNVTRYIAPLRYIITSEKLNSGGRLYIKNATKPMNFIELTEKEAIFVAKKILEMYGDK